MKEEQLLSYQQLQLKRTELESLAKSSEFDSSISGFYVRIKNEDHTYSIASVEGVRMGRPYAIPGLPFCTKHLLISQPPSPNRTCPINTVTDDLITQDDVARWEANLAILQQSSSHRMDSLEANRRRGSLRDSIAESQPITKSRSGTVCSVAPSKLKLTVEMFEQKAAGSKPASRVPEPKEQAAKYDISKFLPSSTDKTENTSTTPSKTSALSKAFESPPVEQDEVEITATTPPQSTADLLDSDKKGKISKKRKADREKSKKKKLKAASATPPRVLGDQLPATSSDTVLLRNYILDADGDGNSIVKKKKAKRPRSAARHSKDCKNPIVQAKKCSEDDISSKKKKKSKKKRVEQSITSVADKKSILDTPIVPDNDSFLDTEEKQSKKQSKNAEKPSDENLRSSSETQVETNLYPTSEENLRKSGEKTTENNEANDSLSNSDNNERIQMEALDIESCTNVLLRSPRKSPKGGLQPRPSSADGLTENTSLTPRGLNLDDKTSCPPITLPVCSVPGCQEWENKKSRQLEKHARQREREFATLNAETDLALQKLEADTQNHTTTITTKQQQERKLFNKKIQADKTALSEIQIQEKKALNRSLQKEREEAHMKLTTEHDLKEKQRIDEFQKQVNLVKKVNRDASIGENELLDHLKFQHDACMNRENHKQLLKQMQLFHQHEQEKLKKRQELEKKHVKDMQQLERDVLIQQLSLTQKQLRQRRWVILDDVRARATVKRQLQEKHQQMEIRHENTYQDVALKLLLKQQQMEREYFGKNMQTHQKQGNIHHQKQKKTLKANFQSNSKKIQRDKTISKEEARLQVEQLKVALNEQIALLEENLSSSQSTDIQNNALKIRHEEQLNELKEERKRRLDALLLFHQTEKNILQSELDADRKEVELRMKGNVEAFMQEEAEMKIAFTEANESNLWALQERHWKESGELQKANHAEQQNFISSIQNELEATPLPAKPSTLNETVDEEELKRQEEERERIQKEKLELQQQLERELEEQQEQEKLQLEQERAKEQEKLKVQIEEEKKEVMETKIQEDEETLRMEYIRKIANDTGLSEDLIAAQLDRIGMPSFMF